MGALNISSIVDGPRLIETFNVSDLRGNFTKVVGDGILIPEVFRSHRAEVFYSKSYRNVLRGLHFQTPPYQVHKFVSVVWGRIQDVVVDLRSDSITFGLHASLELQDTDGLSVHIPPGFAHGFCVLSDFAIVHYIYSDPY